jgi:hypothetical protein
MRALNQSFCPVCNQQWSLVVFGHPRVSPTAPLRSFSPASPTWGFVGLPRSFSVETRLSTGPGVTNEVEWLLQGPGDAEPSLVASEQETYVPLFAETGTHQLTCRVTADTNFVKPQRYGANVDEALWTIEVAELPFPPEVSPPGAQDPVRLGAAGQLSWEDAGASGVASYNLYRGSLAGLPERSYGSCLASGLPDTSTVDEATPAPGEGWFYLVTGSNPLGEGTAGRDSSGVERSPASPCP